MSLTRRFADFLDRLRSGKESERARLAAILELNRALATAADRRHLLTLLLDAAIGLFAAERGFIVLTDDDGGSFRIEAARSLDKENVRAPAGKVSSTVIQRCLQSRSGLFVDDAQEGDFAAAQSVADQRLRSVLTIPLLAGDRLLGCLYLDHRFQSGAFSEQDLPWFQAFADQAAIALHLHLLLEENKRFAEQVAARNVELQRTVAEQAKEIATLAECSRREDLQFPYEDIVGRSPALIRALRTLDRVVPGHFPVLLVGESGTGKELFARAIHSYGPRGAGPFVAVNVAAITPSLLESELFGHRRGAFTGADRDRNGLLQQAHGGVLFLDEITEMDLELQAKLLRFLEDGLVRPLGSERSEHVDLRIVAATNRTPQEEIARGRFRQDLYFRLAVITIELPPLRERRADIPELVRWFLQQAAAARGSAASKTLSEACLEAMARRAWPGNLRQLRNEVFRVDALALGNEIGAELLSVERVEPEPRALDLASLERWAIEEALRHSGGNKAEAARLLGISRGALYHKLAQPGPGTPPQGPGP
jgi:DNA-binding NtrC family response regulator